MRLFYVAQHTWLVLLLAVCCLLFPFLLSRQCYLLFKSASSSELLTQCDGCLGWGLLLGCRYWVFLPTSYHVRGWWLQPSVPWAPMLHVWCRHSGIHIRILPVVPDDYNLAWTTEVTLKCVLWTSEILLTHKLLPRTKIFFFMIYIIFTCVWVLLIHLKW